jgi:hypothetical protein
MNDQPPSSVERHTGDEHWYAYPPTGEVFPSVTTIIGGTSNKPWLAPWSAKLAIEWVLDNQHLLATLPPDEFAAQAKAAAKRARHVKADAGKYAHQVVEALILSQAQLDGDEKATPVPLPTMPDHLAGQLIDELPAEDFHEICMDGFLNFCSDFDVEFIAAEMVVFNAVLGVAGRLDFIALLHKLGITACVDVKSGKWLESVQEQLAAYPRMPECLLPLGQMAQTPATDCGMVLHLRPEYPRGYRLLKIRPADDHKAWNRFRRAVRLFHERRELKGKPGQVIYPPLPDGSQPPTLLRDLDDEGYGRVLRPLIRAGLESVDDVDDVAEMTASACLQIKGIGPKSVPVIEQLIADHATPAPATAGPHQTDHSNHREVA